jgi:hypothetical protein
LLDRQPERLEEVPQKLTKNSEK